MRESHGLLRIGIAMVLSVYVCQAFHLQGMASVRQAVCGNARPCCPGHVCRPYQRFDASRPVAVCALRLHAQPLYAPGSAAQRRFCGTSPADRFRQRRISVRGRSQPFGRQRPGFPGQLVGGQPWGLGGPQQRRQEQGLTAQLGQFSDRSRFDPFRSNPSFGSQRSASRFQVSRAGLGPPGRGSQLNTLAPVPQEQRPFVQGQLQFPQGRPGFSQSPSSFSQGLPSFPQGRSTFPQGRSSFPQGRSSFPQGRSSFPQGRSSFPQGRSSFSQGQTAFSQGQESISQGSQSFGQDLSFIQPQTTGGQGFVEGQDFLGQFSEVGQGSSLSSGSQSLTDQSLGLSDLLPLDGVPQPMLVEQPGVSVSRVPGSITDTFSASPDQSLTITDMASILDMLDQNVNPQPVLVEEPAVPINPALGSESIVGISQDVIQTGASVTQSAPQPQQTLAESIQSAQLTPSELSQLSPVGASGVEQSSMVSTELTPVESIQLKADVTAQQTVAASTQLTSDVPAALMFDVPTQLTSDVPTQLTSDVSAHQMVEVSPQQIAPVSIQQASDVLAHQIADVSQQQVTVDTSLAQSTVVSNNDNNNI